MNTMYRDNDKTDSASDVNLHCNDVLTPLTPENRELADLDIASSRHLHNEDLTSSGNRVPVL